MNLKQINNLTELFFDQFNQQTNKDKILLSTLGDKRKNYSWQETYNFISLVSNELRKVISKGDRCLLISENRPEWFITDLSIMLSDGITVPAYTTYAENDYNYILNDCTPSVIFVSNNEQFNKLKNIIFVFSILITEKIYRGKERYNNINGSQNTFSKIPVKNKKIFLVFILCFTPFIFGFLIPFVRLYLGMFLIIQPTIGTEHQERSTTY